VVDNVGYGQFFAMAALLGIGMPAIVLVLILAHHQPRKMSHSSSEITTGGML